MQKYLCSNYFDDYGEMLKFLRQLKQENIMQVITFQKGIIFKKYSYTVLYYRTIS